MDKLTEAKERGIQAAAAAADLQDLDAVRVEYLGKKGIFADFMKELAALSKEERPARGAEINAVKQEVVAALEAKREEIENRELNAKLASEKVDITLPGRRRVTGTLHPVTRTIERIEDLFGAMGFETVGGPEIEDDYHNFDALNLPPHHPARASHDTFMLDNGLLLRSQTSSVQIRVMEKIKPPIRIIAPGRVYRNDYDMTHTPMFHQVEGLVIDKNITMAHLKGCLYDFVKAFFELDDIPVRYRPSYFPFTEPSAEMDIGCLKTKTELKIGAGTDWLEILGCGMVHPSVLRAGGIDPDEYQGFAFGMGIDRLAMLKYGIPDLRTFFESDVRWLKHYGFSPMDFSSMTGGLSDNGGSLR